MKLVDMKARPALDVIAELAPIMAIVIADEELSDSIEEIIKIYGNTKEKKKLVKMIKPILTVLIPKLAKNYQNELFKFTNILSGVDMFALENMNIFEFTNTFIKVLNEDITNFFMPA